MLKDFKLKIKMHSAVRYIYFWQVSEHVPKIPKAFEIRLRFTRVTDAEV